MRRLVCLLVACLLAVCPLGCRDPVSTNPDLHVADLSLDFDVSALDVADLEPPDLTPLPAPRGVDILVVSSVSGSLMPKMAAEAAVRLRGALLARLTHTSPADVRLGVIAGLVAGPWCGSDIPKPVGVLSPNSSGDVITTAQQDDAAWRDQFRFLYKHCWIEQHLAAARLALDGRNPGFPRPDALLAVLMLTNQDDCSVADGSLFSQPALFPDNLSPSYYPRCQVPPPGLLEGVADYVDALLQAHPQRIFVGAVASTEPVTFIPDGPYITVKTLRSCMLDIDPGPRFGQFFDALEARKHPRLRAVLIDSIHGTCPWDMDIFAQGIVEWGDL